MEKFDDHEHMGVSHLAGSIKQQRQHAIKVDVTADVLAERIKVKFPDGSFRMSIKRIQVLCTVADDNLSMKTIYQQDVQRYTKMFNSSLEEEESIEVATCGFVVTNKSG